MKIALVHYSYAPVIGGVERVMEEHAQLFVRTGHEVTVLCLRGESDVSGIRVVPLPRDSANLHGALRSVLSDAEVVFVHNVMTMPFHPDLTLALEALAPELPRTRFVGWIHDVAACNPDLAPVPEWARRAHERFEYVSVSELRRVEWRELTGLDSVVIPNGIDPARVLGLPANVAAFAEQHDLLDGQIVLLHPTRLLRRKNVELSLGVVGELIRMERPAVLIVTGAADPHNPVSREYAAWLQEECTRQQANALFAGEHLSIRDAELAALYRLADALIFPSRQEGFGLPVLEAALHRLPIFCSDIEPLRELAGPQARLFSPNASPASVAAQIVEALDREAGFLARRRALTEFSWRAIYQWHLEPLLDAAEG
jgi:mannosylglucosylglycerate synthase